MKKLSNIEYYYIYDAVNELAIEAWKTQKHSIFDFKLAAKLLHILLLYFLIYFFFLMNFTLHIAFFL
jgi:hypothetical protein